MRAKIGRPASTWLVNLLQVRLAYGGQRCTLVHPGVMKQNPALPEDSYVGGNTERICLPSEGTGIRRLPPHLSYTRPWSQSRPSFRRGILSALLGPPYKVWSDSQLACPRNYTEPGSASAAKPHVAAEAVLGKV